MSDTKTFLVDGPKPRKRMDGPRFQGWKESEDNIVLEKVRDYPDNLAEAFRQAVPLLPLRSKAAIAFHYYDVLAKKHNILAVGTKKGFTQPNVKNRTNKSIGQTVPLKPQLQHLHKILIDIMQMSDEEKEKLKTFVNTIL